MIQISLRWRVEIVLMPPPALSTLKSNLAPSTPGAAVFDLLSFPSLLSEETLTRNHELCLAPRQLKSIASAAHWKASKPPFLRFAGFKGWMNLENQ